MGRDKTPKIRYHFPPPTYLFPGQLVLTDVESRLVAPFVNPPGAPPVSCLTWVNVGRHRAPVSYRRRADKTEHSID